MFYHQRFSRPFPRLFGRPPFQTHQRHVFTIRLFKRLRITHFVHPSQGRVWVVELNYSEDKPPIFLDGGRRGTCTPEARRQVIYSHFRLLLWHTTKSKRKKSDALGQVRMILCAYALKIAAQQNYFHWAITDTLHSQWRTLIGRTFTHNLWVVQLRNLSNCFSFSENEKSVWCGGLRHSSKN